MGAGQARICKYYVRDARGRLHDPEDTGIGKSHLKLPLIMSSKPWFSYQVMRIVRANYIVVNFITEVFKIL